MSAASFKIEKGGRDPDPVLHGGDAELSRLASETSVSSSLFTKTTLTLIAENPPPARYRQFTKNTIVPMSICPLVEHLSSQQLLER